MSLLTDLEGMKAVELWKAGMSVGQIAETLGRGEGRVRDHLNELKLRRPGQETSPETVKSVSIKLDALVYDRLVSAAKRRGVRVEECSRIAERHSATNEPRRSCW